MKGRGQQKDKGQCFFTLFLFSLSITLLPGAGCPSLEQEKARPPYQRQQQDTIT